MPKFKAEVVIANVEAEAIASIMLDAPLGVTVDPKTGQLSTPIRVEAEGDPVLRWTIISGTLIIEGILQATVILGKKSTSCDNCSSMTVYVPVFASTDIKDISTGDHCCITATPRHFSLSGIPELSPGSNMIITTKLSLHALLSIKIDVTRQELINIPEEGRKIDPPDLLQTKQITTKTPTDKRSSGKQQNRSAKSTKKRYQSKYWWAL